MPARNVERIDGLTPRQIQLLKLIASFCDRRRYSPTIAELAAEMRISRSTVFEHLGELQRKGLLSTSPAKARSLKVTSSGQGLLRRLGDSQTGAGDEIPLLGQVAAGIPVEAIENTESLSLDSCFGSGDGMFALEVRGDSMIEDDIHPGDYVVCRRTSSANNGALVVALVDDGEATLKRFYKERGRVRLQPANPKYDPIYTNNCHIEGVVVGLMRKL